MPWISSYYYDFAKGIKKRVREHFFRRQIGKCGQNLNVYGQVCVVDGESIEIGNDFKINDGCKLISRNTSRILIGNDVTLSANVTILSTGYDIDHWFQSGEKKHKPMNTFIGNHVWICAGATIVGNVKITGDYVIIGAGAVVTDDIPESYCLYAGVPAKLIKYYSVKE